MRNSSGFFMPKGNEMHYQKLPLTFDAQVDQLISRGLNINEKLQAIIFLQKISYYRLSAYFLPFYTRNKDKEFKIGTNFNNIINLYTFDQQLRHLVLEAIEEIEIAIRTQIIYHLSHKYGAFGYLEPQNFSSKFNHQKWTAYLQEYIDKSTETFIGHYKNRYTTPNLPIWMALEVMPFGGLSHLFSGLKGEDKQSIAQHYGLKDQVLSSWLHTFVYLRNLCAHHARLWNRTLTLKPKLPAKDILWHGVNNDRAYSMLAIIQYLLCKINQTSNWKYKLIDLLKNNPEIPGYIMGFPNDWLNHPLWGNDGALHHKKSQQAEANSNTNLVLTD